MKNTVPLDPSLIHRIFQHLTLYLPVRFVQKIAEILVRAEFAVFAGITATIPLSRWLLNAASKILQADVRMIPCRKAIKLCTKTKS